MRDRPWWTRSASSPSGNLEMLVNIEGTKVTPELRKRFRLGEFLAEKAIAGIAYLKQAGKERVTIVGEPVGDRMMFFSDGLPIRLERPFVLAGSGRP